MKHTKQNNINDATILMIKTLIYSLFVLALAVILLHVTGTKSNLVRVSLVGCLQLAKVKESFWPSSDVGTPETRAIKMVIYYLPKPYKSISSLRKYVEFWKIIYPPDLTNLREKTVMPLTFHDGTVSDGLHYTFQDDVDGTLKVGILYLHGGALVAGSAQSEAGFATDIGRRLSKLLGPRVSVEVLTTNYRLLPEATLSEAVEDAVGSYLDMIHGCRIPPERIIILGPSGGGTLSLLTVLKLAKDGHPLPAGAVILSPSIGLEHLPNTRYDKLDYEDNTFTGYGFYEWISGIVNTSENVEYFKDIYKYISKSPPLMITYGTEERRKETIKNLCDIASNSGIDVKCRVYQGMPHIFQVFGFLLKESSLAIDEFLFWAITKLSLEQSV